MERGLFGAPTGLAESRSTYLPWFALRLTRYMSSFAIWQTGKVDHPLRDPDSLIQPHCVWCFLSAVATACLYVFLGLKRKETASK
jgi:hypothetical protein